jgi:hypothetical protein
MTGGLFGWYGFQCIFHCTTCIARSANRSSCALGGQYMPQHLSLNCGSRGVN